MEKTLHIQLQVGREKLEGVKMEFEKIRIATTNVEEKIATKATDKMRLTKYNISLGEGTLKAILTIELVHPAFQLKEPTSLELEPRAICGN
jgi:hypothetical protein